jgi:hypothetical protein
MRNRCVFKMWDRDILSVDPEDQGIASIWRVNG